MVHAGHGGAVGTTSVVFPTNAGSGPIFISRDDPGPLRSPSSPSLRRLILAPKSA
jgi:hypothetical protein